MVNEERTLFFHFFLPHFIKVISIYILWLCEYCIFRAKLYTVAVFSSFWTYHLPHFIYWIALHVWNRCFLKVLFELLDVEEFLSYHGGWFVAFFWTLGTFLQGPPGSCFNCFLSPAAHLSSQSALRSAPGLTFYFLHDIPSWSVFYCSEETSWPWQLL